MGFILNPCCFVLHSENVFVHSSFKKRDANVIFSQGGYCVKFLSCSLVYIEHLVGARTMHTHSMAIGHGQPAASWAEMRCQFVRTCSGTYSSMSRTRARKKEKKRERIHYGPSSSTACLLMHELHKPDMVRNKGAHFTKGSCSKTKEGD